MAFPHSNCRAEVGVKKIKQLITNNVGGPGGNLNVDEFQRAILQYQNTPDKDTELSPAMCIFSRPIKDLVPILPGKYQPHAVWKGSLLAREKALRQHLWSTTKDGKLTPDCGISGHLDNLDTFGWSCGGSRELVITWEVSAKETLLELCS